MQKALQTLAALATATALAACGARTEGGDPKTDDSTVEAPSAATAPAATTPPPGDSAATAGGAPYVVQNGGPVTPANGTGQMAPGDTAYGNAGPAGPSSPGGKDTLVTKSKTAP